MCEMRSEEQRFALATASILGSLLHGNLRASLSFCQRQRSPSVEVRMRVAPPEARSRRENDADHQAQPQGAAVGGF